MNSKILSFEKGLFKVDIKRFWIFGLLYSALMFFSTFFGFYVSKDNYSLMAVNTSQYVNSALFRNAYFSHFFGVLAGAILALVLFWFLNSVSAISFYHGLPFRRKKIYISKLVSAFTLLTLPVLVVTGIVLISRLLGSNINVRISHLLLWTAIQLIYSYMGFACTVFTAILTGNILSHLALTGICLILPAVIVSFIDSITATFLYGYSGSIYQALSYIYIMPAQMVTKKCLIYIFTVIILLVVSYFLYEKRALEKNGEAFVFTSVKNIFVGAAALLGGIFSYWYFMIWFNANILFMLPFGIIALIIANMINKKRLTLKGSALYAGIFIIFVLALSGSFKLDVFGYQNRVPDINKVMSVTINENEYFNIQGSSPVVSYEPKEGKELYEKNAEKYEIKKREDIEKIIAFHKYRTKNHHGNKAQNSITLNYTLRNGRHLKRSYFFNHDEDKQYVEPLSNIEAWVKQRYVPYEKKNVNINTITVGTLMQNLNNDMRLTFISGSEEFELLKNALMADIEALPYDEDATLYNGINNANAYITVHYVAPLVYEDGSDYVDWRNRIMTNTYTITDGFKNTLAFLQSMESFGEIDFTADKIKRIGIARYDNYKEGGTIPFGDDWDVSEIVTDRAEIDAIVNRLKHGYKSEMVGDEIGSLDYIIETVDEKYFSVNSNYIKK